VGGERLGEKKKGKMTVEEAGRKGGEKTSETHGEEFYTKIGRKGGQKVRKLIEQGKEYESETENQSE
jgi:general stress protein YciG